MELIFLILGILAILYEPKPDKVFPNGLTIDQAAKILETQTHCGYYWDVKVKYNKENEIVYVWMEGNEYVEIRMLESKEMYRKDLD